MNPLDMMGPEFLQFYLLYGAGILAVAWLAWLYLRSALEPSSEVLRWSPGVYPREGDAYEIALLRGGGREVARTLLARLISAGRIALVGDTLRRPSEDTPRLPPIEASALEALPDGTQAAHGEQAVHQAVEPYLAPMEDDLQRQGLILTASQVQRFQALCLMVLVALLGLGLTKAVVAIGRGRANIGFLVLMMAGYAVAAYFLLKPPRHTRAGERYLSWLQESHRGLVALVTNERRESGDELLLAAGIYGLQALPTMGLLHIALRPQSRTKEQDHSSGGGGCGTYVWGGDSGGGGDGGGGGGGDGGGCGGGGCGGGGCGGCGS